MTRASVIIRTFNEERYLRKLLEAVRAQETPGTEVEVLVVDSGSTDATLTIAQEFGVRILHIPKEEFSFGRSLNLGCRASTGDALVFVSGHCIPVGRDWLSLLTAPLRDGIAYAYGRQVGGAASRFSELRIFEKFFPATSRIPQEGAFVNNANAALLRSAWEASPFDETLTGLEDMHLGNALVKAGHRIAYVAEAPVHHLHHESWPQVRRRFEREAIALRHIHPEIHISIMDFARYFVSAVMLDFGSALAEKRLGALAYEIVRYRLAQFWGSYRGNHEHRKLSREAKERYFYPKSSGKQESKWLEQKDSLPSSP